jgi:hypothetical protein
MNEADFPFPDAIAEPELITRSIGRQGEMQYGRCCDWT